MLAPLPPLRTPSSSINAKASGAGRGCKFCTRDSSRPIGETIEYVSRFPPCRRYSSRNVRPVSQGDNFRGVVRVRGVVSRNIRDVGIERRQKARVSTVELVSFPRRRIHPALKQSRMSREARRKVRVRFKRQRRRRPFAVQVLFREAVRAIRVRGFDAEAVVTRANRQPGRFHDALSRRKPRRASRSAHRSDRSRCHGSKGRKLSGSQHGRIPAAQQIRQNAMRLHNSISEMS